MKHGGLTLAGAKSRLLPPSIPYRFFLAAILFHAASWAVLAAGADEVPTFQGGPGLPLASLHLLTLGVLSATAMGAAFQLLPVATKVPLRAAWPARLASWMFLPGTAILAHGMAIGRLQCLEIGGFLVIGGLAIFLALIADNLYRTVGLGVVVAHVWGALASLAALAVLAALLIANYEFAFLGDTRPVGIAHLVLAVYGFMGLLALGFSHVLLPMFALAEAPASRLGYASLGAIAGAILLCVAGAVLQAPAALALGAVLGLAGAGIHVFSLVMALRTRMRKRLGLPFALIRGAWVLLPASVLVGLAATLDLPVPNVVTLFGFVAVFGWLLSFLLGVLQKIMPFLASMHATRPGAKPPLAHQLASETPLRVHAACHAAALALVTAGIVLDWAPAVRLGALVGLAGALAFAWFGGVVVWRMTRGAGSAPATVAGAST